jgi:hypothetical protein
MHPCSVRCSSCILCSDDVASIPQCGAYICGTVVCAKALLPEVESTFDQLMEVTVMLRNLTALAAVAAISIAAIAAPTPAEARGGRIAAGVIGGLAAGAIIGGAVAGPYGPYGYYGYPAYYGPGPYYYGPGCYWRRVWTEFGWRRTRVCY